MAATFSVQVAGLDEFQRRYRGADDVFQQELGTAMGRVVLAAEGAMIEEAPWASGALRQSIQSRVEPISGGVRGIAGPDANNLAGAMRKYAIHVIRGRQPGRMPPVLPLMDWVMVKERRLGIFGINLNDQKQIRRVAYAVGRNIARRGIEPNDFMTRAIQKIWPAAEREFRERMPNEIAKRMTGGGR